MFSAAFIAHVEATYEDDTVRNDLCVPVPHPDSYVDWLRVAIANDRNSVCWAGDEGLQHWLANARLQLYRELMPPRLEAVPFAAPADPFVSCPGGRRPPLPTLPAT